MLEINIKVYIYLKKKKLTDPKHLNSGVYTHIYMCVYIYIYIVHYYYLLDNDETNFKIYNLSPNTKMKGWTSFKSRSDMVIEI